MVIKWGKKDVIDAFNEAMNPPQPTGILPEQRRNVLQTLLEKARAGREVGGTPQV